MIALLAGATVPIGTPIARDFEDFFDKVLKVPGDGGLVTAYQPKPDDCLIVRWPQEWSIGIMSNANPQCSGTASGLSAQDSLINCIQQVLMSEEARPVDLTFHDEFGLSGRPARGWLKQPNAQLQPFDCP